MSSAMNALKLLGSQQSSGVSYNTSTSFSFEGTLTSVLFRATLIILVVLIVLLFIHYTFYPIFKMKPDQPGFISIPNVASSDAVFWTKKKDIIKLDVAKTPIGSSGTGSNYSLTIDIQIDDAQTYTGLPRIIFYKGLNALNTITEANKAATTAAGMTTDGSLIFALNRETNDLEISIITVRQNTSEGVLLNNVPLRKAFRVGVIVSDKQLEVYTNGLLARTRALSSPPKSILGYFWPSPTNGIQLRNLHIWPTTILPGEMRAALPALDQSLFDTPALAETQTCPRV